MGVASYTVPITGWSATIPIVPGSFTRFTTNRVMVLQYSSNNSDWHNFSADALTVPSGMNATIPAAAAYIRAIAYGTTGTLTIFQDPGASDSGARVPTVVFNSTSAKTANRLALQASLAGGGHVRWEGSGRVYVDGPVVGYSNTYLDISKTFEIISAPGTQKELFQTDAYINGVDTSITITWTSGFNFTVGWTAHGKAADSWIAIQGSLIGTGTEEGDRIFNGNFRIQSVTDANNFVCALERLPTAAPGGTPVARACTENFHMSGGVWNYDNANNVGASGLALMGMNIGYVARSSFRDIIVKDSAKFCFYFFCLADTVIEDLWPYNPNSDGVKIFSPLKHVTIDGVRGASYDDFFSIQSSAAPQYAYVIVTTGDMYDVKVSNIHGKGTDTGSVAVVYLWEDYYVDDIVFDGISGDGFAQCGHVTTDAGSNGGNFRNIEFRNFMGGPTYGFRALNVGSGGTLRLINGTHAPNGITTLPVINIGSNTTISKIHVSGMVADQAAWLPSTASYVAQFTGACDDITIEDSRIYLRNSNSRGIQFNATTLKSVVVRRLNMTSGAGANIIESSAGGTPTYKFEDCVVLGGASTAFFSPSAACSVVIDGGDYNTVSNAILRPNGAFTVTAKVIGRPKFTSAPLSALFGGAVLVLDNTDALAYAPQSVASAAAPALDCSLGGFVTMSALATNPTWAAPTNVPALGTMVHIKTVTDGGGARTIAFNAAYKNTGVFNLVSGAGVQTTVFSFVSDGTNLVAVAPNAWY